MIYEVEKRALINTRQVASFKRFLKKNGKLLGDVKRFTLVFSKEKSFIPDPKGLNDLRIRATKDMCLLTLKHGSWHGSNRQEYDIQFSVDEFYDLVGVLNLLGNPRGIIMYVQRFAYEYKGFEIVIDDYYKDNKNVIEIEKLCKTKLTCEKAEKDIDKLFSEFKLEHLDSKNMQDYVNYLFSRKFWRFDFKKISLKSWYKNWEKYIKCKM